MNESVNVWIALAPGIAILIIFLSFLAIFLVRQPNFDQKASRTAGSVLLPRALIRYAYWMSDGVVEPLSRIGVRPNHITLLSVAMSATTALLVVYEHAMAAAWVLFGAMACDLLDGLLARSLDLQSDAGAFFDSFCDRAAEGMVFGGLAYLGRDTPLFSVSIWALVASYLVSYARGRGEGLGVDCTVGLMQRAERLLLVFAVLFGAPLLAAAVGPDGPQALTFIMAGILLLAVLTTVTAGQRAFWIMSALDDGDDDESTSASGKVVEASS